MQNQAENKDKPCTDSVVTMVIFYSKQDVFRDGQAEERMAFSATKGVDLHDWQGEELHCPKLFTPTPLPAPPLGIPSLDHVTGITYRTLVDFLDAGTM